MRARWFVPGVIALGAMLALALLLAAFGVWLPARRARRLIDDAAAIHFSRSTEADLTQLLGEPAQTQGGDCRHRACTLIWIVNNGVLNDLRLAPPTAVNVGVVLMDGSAQAVWASLASRDRSGNLHGAMLTMETENGLVPNAPVPNTGGIPDYITMSAVVRIEQAPQFALSRDCLVHFGGCHNAADVVPWVKWH